MNIPVSLIDKSEPAVVTPTREENLSSNSVLKVSSTLTCGFETNLSHIEASSSRIDSINLTNLQFPTDKLLLDERLPLSEKNKPSITPTLTDQVTTDVVTKLESSGDQFIESQQSYKIISPTCDLKSSVDILKSPQSVDDVQFKESFAKRKINKRSTSQIDNLPQNDQRKSVAMNVPTHIQPGKLVDPILSPTQSKLDKKSSRRTSLTIRRDFSLTMPAKAITEQPVENITDQSMLQRRKSSSAISKDKVSETNFIYKDKNQILDWQTGVEKTSVSVLSVRSDTSDDPKLSENTSIFDSSKDESPLFTDFTTSSITNVSDRIESSLETDAADDSGDHSCSKLWTISNSDKTEIRLQQENEKSVSISDNAASDFSPESINKLVDSDTLPMDLDFKRSYSKQISSSSQEEKFAKYQKIHERSNVGSRNSLQETSSPHSETTEYTESISCIESIIDGNIEKINEKLHKTNVEKKSTAKIMKLGKTDNLLEPKLTSVTKETRKDKRNLSSACDTTSDVDQDISNASSTVTRTKLYSKRSRATTKQSPRKITTTEVTTATTSKSLTKCSTRTFGYMQSTLSRDQKIHRHTDVSHSSPSRSSSKYGSEKRATSSEKKEISLKRSISSEKKDLEKQSLNKEKVPVSTRRYRTSSSTENRSSSIEYRSSSVEKRPSNETENCPNSSERHSNSRSGFRSRSSERGRSSRPDTHNVSSEQKASKMHDTIKTQPKSKNITEKVKLERITKGKCDSSKSRVDVKSSKTEAKSVVQKGYKPEIKIQPTVKSSKATVPKIESDNQFKSPKLKATHTSKAIKDAKNISLIPVKKQYSTVISKVKSNRGEPHQTNSSADDKHVVVQIQMSGFVEQTANKVQKLQLEKHSDSKIRRKEEEVERCQSALQQYSNKDSLQALSKDTSSLPSSPIHIKRPNSSNSNNTHVITSEVFTRTVDSSKSIEVIYQQPSSKSELTRKINEYRYNDFDVSFIETTDSSLSDSIALPSTSSDYEYDGFGKRKRSCSPASPKPTKRALQLIKRTDNLLKLKDDDKKIIEHYQQQISSSISSSSINQNQIRQSRYERTFSNSSTSNAPALTDSKISPIVDSRAVTSPRQKAKYDFDQYVMMEPGEPIDTIIIDDHQDVTSTKGDENDLNILLIRNEAINLIDSILEESVGIIITQSDNYNKIDSESEHFAITSDISQNGIDFIKSPTIESMSGKSFDENLSAHSGGARSSSYHSQEHDHLIENSGLELNDDHQMDSKHTICKTNAIPNIIRTSSTRIEKKFERLSSQIDDYDKNDDLLQNDFDQALKSCAIDKDDLSNLQHDFSKMSWDDTSLSQTTADGGLITPDTDLHAEPGSLLPLHSDNVIPKPTPRTRKSLTSDEFSVEKDFTKDENLESILSIDDKLTAQPNPPIPKPRSTSIQSTKSTYSSLQSHSSQNSVSIETVAIHGSDESKRSIERYDKSEADTSVSLKSSRDDDTSIINAQLDKLEDESFPTSEKFDEDSISIIIQSKDDKTVRDDIVEELEDDNDQAQTKFYIGELSTNIITKTATEKRSEFAYDNEGYGSTQDSTKEDEFSTKVEVSESTQSTVNSTSTSVTASSKQHKFIEIQQHKPSKIPHLDHRKIVFDSHKLELNLEKSETEIPEKGKNSDVHKKSHIPVLHEDRTKHSDKQVLHSPLKGSKTSQEFEKPTDIKNMKIEMAKATAVEVVRDVEPTIPVEWSVDIQQSKKFEMQDTEQDIDELVVEQTLAEVKESLDAVQEELIGVVKDGKLIKQSPSEFEFKILPQLKYTTDPIIESYQEDLSKPATESTNQISESSGTKTKDPPLDEIPSMAVCVPKHFDYEEIVSSSNEDSFNKLDVVRRKTTKTHLKHEPNRWSVTDVESSSGESHYQSFEKTDSSRPCSSDIENLLNSSEYQTAQDQSLIPTEYHSAVSSLRSRSGEESSRDSMKSLDSESSGNLGSIEVSEASETLVPSAAELEMESLDIQDDLDLGIEVEDNCGSLEDKCPGILLESENSPLLMKRSHEMTFMADAKSHLKEEKVLDSEEKPDTVIKYGSITNSIEIEKLSSSFDESRFGSLEDGSILSVSISSTSCLETVMENLPDSDMMASLPGSLVGSYEIPPLLADDVNNLSTEILDSLGTIDNHAMTSSYVSDDKHSVNTQITTTMSSEIVTKLGGEHESTTIKSKKGHKRSESTIPTGFAFAGIGSEDDIAAEKPIEHEDLSTSLEDEMIIHEAHPKPTPTVDKESESDSDYDRYESEYSRSFKIPTSQSKRKPAKDAKALEKDENEQPKRPYSPSLIIETIVEDINAEVELEKEREIRISQNMQDYSNIPDITITHDLTKQLSSDDEKSAPTSDETQPEKNEKDPTSKPTATPTTDTEVQKEIKYAQQIEYSMSEDQYQEMIMKQYKSKQADEVIKRYDPDIDDDDKADSAGSDSFEMLEQPDISDEFVIIEEVAKEADEFDQEGKSLVIKKTKSVKKHDEEVENIVIRSAPAATNEGSMLYAQIREDMNFEFEDSPPGGVQHQPQGVGMHDFEPDDNGASIDASRRWVEMQLTANRYPYELDRGILEDIKEEDTDFEAGSSRISSFKDSFSSTPDYDVLAGRKYFSKEHDDISVNSLQEFENLEQAISFENRKLHQVSGSSDSLSNGSFTKRFLARSAGQGDEISLNSLKEFEGLETACIEAQLIELKAREEAALLLSRSDESNKSEHSIKASPPRTTGTSITTVTTVTKTSGEPGTAKSTSIQTTTITSSSSSSTSGTAISKNLDDLIRSRFETLEDETSNTMEVSTDSLERGRQIYDKDLSQHASSDSLEINKSGAIDIMTSSLDSIEPLSKGATTGKSSRSEPDSIEQIVDFTGGRSDSVDSIELQIALLNQQSKMDRDSIDDNIITDVSSSISGGGSGGSRIVTVTQTITTTSSSSHYEMPKDISNDSLNSGFNLNTPFDPDVLITSTDSFDHSSSTATNATYQNESQMSGSMTSCDSNTILDIIDESNLDMFSPCGNVPTFLDTSEQQYSSTTHHQMIGGHEKRYDYSEIYDDDGKLPPHSDYDGKLPHSDDGSSGELPEEAEQPGSSKQPSAIEKK